jgi:hypothetical protein
LHGFQLQGPAGAELQPQPADFSVYWPAECNKGHMETPSQETMAFLGKNIFVPGKRIKGTFFEGMSMHLLNSK